MVGGYSASVVDSRTLRCSTYHEVYRLPPTKATDFLHHKTYIPRTRTVMRLSLVPKLVQPATVFINLRGSSPCRALHF